MDNMIDRFIDKTLTLSASHVKEEVMSALWADANSNYTNDGGYGLFVMQKYEFGFTIFVGNTLRDVDYYKNDVPEELYNCMVLAVTHGCCWLCLDGAGLEYPGLETFDW